MTRGGKRQGSGRPKGSNQYGESTKAIRIPLSRVEEVKQLVNNKTLSYHIPLFSSKVRAGFPSPADDYIETNLDLNEHLIKHPASTFFLKAEGDSMKEAGINTGDILIVDRSVEPSSGKIVIAAINGELTVKRLYRTEGRVELRPENKTFKAIAITEEQDLVIWGVVTYVIHQAI